MNHIKLSKKQKDQEKDYIFPYHYLDLGAPEYELIKNIPEISLLKFVKKLMKPLDDKVILDLGCGDGRFCHELKDEKCHVTGVDYSKKAIEFAKAFNPGTEFFVQDITNLKLEEKYDYIVSIEVLEHIIPKDLPKLVKNISKLLKKNGKVIITVPSVNRKMQIKHYQHFTVVGLIKLFEPEFKAEKVFGYGRMDLSHTFFKFLQLLGFLIFPLRNKIPLLFGYYNFIRKYYNKNLLVGDPKNSTGIIVLFGKK